MLRWASVYVPRARTQRNILLVFFLTAFVISLFFNTPNIVPAMRQETNLGDKRGEVLALEETIREMEEDMKERDKVLRTEIENLKEAMSMMNRTETNKAFPPSISCLKPNSHRFGESRVTGSTKGVFLYPCNAIRPPPPPPPPTDPSFIPFL